MSEKQINAPGIRPVILDPSSFVILPKEHWDCPCAVCEHPRAKWALREAPDKPDGIPVCGLCFLNDSPWARENRSDIIPLINEIEHSSGSKFKKMHNVVDPGFLLLECKDADQVLGAIVVVSKIYSKLKHNDDDDGSENN